MALTIERSGNLERLIQQLSQAQKSSASELEKLASGKKNPQAKDNAAAVQIAVALANQMIGDQQGLENLQEADSMLAVAEGAMSEIQNNLSRIEELTVQAANDTYSPEQRQAIQSEISARQETIGRIASSTSFSGKKLLDGTAQTVVQAGSNSDNTLDVSAGLSEVSLSTLGIGSIDVSSGANARNALSAIKQASKALTAQRVAVGTSQNQIANHSEAAAGRVITTETARSAIEDTDIASSLSKESQAQIKSAASSALLAQTLNTSRSSAARLLGS